MALMVRRVVTGHNAEGKAVVVDDREMDNVIVMPSGNSGALMWVSEETPAGVDSFDDPSNRKMGISPPPGGSAFRVLEVLPGKQAFMHRTDSIDYAIVMKGDAVMLLDDGEEVAMQAGDVMVQRGTWHGWENRSDAPVQIGFVLISSLPPAKHWHADAATP
ncbi:MAG: cupin domain-containing protein [Rhodospirillaceae bacterium]|jgi:quercetin dioxygenase-like cupin family protein|nr:cupin domain-containing protein [Rhodospirillaceae bacterium]